MGVSIADKASRRLGLLVILVPMILSAMLLGGCSQHRGSAQASDFTQGAGEYPVRMALPEPRQNEARTPAQRQLRSAVDRLGSEFDGRVGITVIDIENGWTTGFNAEQFMPQQSVSKLWVALTALDRVDALKLDLSRNVVLGYEDLTLFHQPVARLARLPGGHATTLDTLLEKAITESDNTANDYLLWQVGGPGTVRATLAEKGIHAVRFGPGERLLQSSIAGVDWRQEYSIDRTFYDVRNRVPEHVRGEAFDRYVADPIDGATAFAIADALARLHRGELLSGESTEKFLGILSRTKSGPRRLKAGVPPQWSIGHKTGTGQVFRDAQAGYNDVGIVTAPSGRSYAVAVLIGHTRAPIPARMKLMQNVVGAIAEYEATHGAAGGQDEESGTTVS
jgi:beta-lactamase class A